MSATPDPPSVPPTGDLILAEELALLAYDDEAGKDRSGYGVDAGLAGALLVDLGAAGCLETQDKKLVATGRPAPDHPLLTEALGSINRSGKPRDAKRWLRQLGKDLKPLKDRVLQGLVERGIMTKEERRVFRLFPYNRYPQVDPEPERALRERLAAAVLGERVPTDRDALLLALLRPYDLVKHLVPRDRRREANRRAKELADQGIAGKAVEKAVQEVQAAILVAVTASTAAAAASSSGT